jgi:hypothetical protein
MLSVPDVFLTFGFYDRFLDERTKNIGDRGIRKVSKYPRKMEEVIDAMDWIVEVWRLRRDWYFATSGFRFSRVIIKVLS